MKMKDQVASVEPAKELRELGVKQDSVWFWTWAEWNEEVTWVLILQEGARAGLKKETFSAYTVAELGEMLPTDYVTGKLALDEENAQKWACVYLSIPEFEPWCDRVEFADTEADVRAKMLIRLIKEGLVKVEEIE